MSARTVDSHSGDLAEQSEVVSDEGTHAAAPVLVGQQREDTQSLR
jgi:hypothetical protein